MTAMKALAGMRSLTMTIREIEVSIRVEAAKVRGYPHTDIGYKVTEDGRVSHYYTRLNYILHDSPHARSHQLELFKRRQGWTND
jgi:hypothetical protein